MFISENEILGALAILPIYQNKQSHCNGNLDNDILTSKIILSL